MGCAAEGFSPVTGTGASWGSTLQVACSSRGGVRTERGGGGGWGGGEAAAAAGGGHRILFGVAGEPREQRQGKGPRPVSPDGSGLIP